jgi:hypothetical protein
MLQLYGFDSDKTRAMLVRHTERLFLFDEIANDNSLAVYQAYQHTEVFKNQDRIVSFYGLSSNRSCFYGVFKVNGCRLTKDVKSDVSYPWGRRVSQM